MSSILNSYDIVECENCKKKVYRYELINIHGKFLCHECVGIIDDEIESKKLEDDLPD